MSFYILKKINFWLVYKLFKSHINNYALKCLFRIFGPIKFRAIPGNSVTGRGRNTTFFWGYHDHLEIF